MIFTEKGKSRKSNFEEKNLFFQKINICAAGNEPAMVLRYSSEGQGLIK